MIISRERSGPVRWTVEQVRVHYARLGRPVPPEVEAILADGKTVNPPINRRGGHWTSHIERGRREDLGGIYFRSRAEANWARWLTYQGLRWEYEPRTFDFLPFRPYRRNTSYTPDFYVVDLDEYHEVKGWMTPDSKTKLARMKLHYPEIRIRVVLLDELAEIERKLGRVIPGWEFGERRCVG